MAGGLVRVDKGDSVHIDGSGLGSVGEKILSIASDSGFSIGSIDEYGINNPAGKSSVGAGTVRAFHHGMSVTP